MRNWQPRYDQHAVAACMAGNWYFLNNFCIGHTQWHAHLATVFLMLMESTDYCNTLPACLYTYFGDVARHAGHSGASLWGPRREVGPLGILACGPAPTLLRHWLTHLNFLLTSITYFLSTYYVVCHIIEVHYTTAQLLCSKLVTGPFPDIAPLQLN